jgi:hypothetical protein
LKDCQSSVPPRHRGKSPQQAAFFTRSARARHESALFASLCRLIGALPAPAAGATTAAMTPGTPSEPAARSFAGLNRGELLCQAYESYRTLFPSPLISFEHAVFLLGALWRGNELVLGSCRDCNAVLVADRWSLRTPRCVVCAQGTDSEQLGPFEHAAQAAAEEHDRETAGGRNGRMERPEGGGRHALVEAADPADDDVGDEQAHVRNPHHRGINAR